MSTRKHLLVDENTFTTNLPLNVSVGVVTPTTSAVPLLKCFKHPINHVSCILISALFVCPSGLPAI